MKEINPQTPEPISQVYDTYLNTTAYTHLFLIANPKYSNMSHLLLYNRAKVVTESQPTLLACSQSWALSPRECPTAQQQIRLNDSFFLYGEFKNFQQPPNSPDALNDS